MRPATLPTVGEDLTDIAAAEHRQELWAWGLDAVKRIWPRPASR